MKLGLHAAIFIALLLGGLGASYFKLKQMNDARLGYETDATRQEAVLADLEKSTRGIDDLDAKINSLGEAVRFFQAKLPQEGDVASILDRVTEIAEAQALVNKNFQPSGKIETGPNYREQTIDITFAGDFKNFYAFLLQLEQMPRLTRIPQMSLTKIQGREGEMEAEVKLSIFFEPAPAAAFATIK